MFEKVPFKAEHLMELLKEPTNDGIRADFTLEGAKTLENHETFTGMLDGRPVICGGTVPFWKGRAYAWTVFSGSTKSNFLPVFRAIKQHLNSLPYTRIEMCVPFNFKEGHRRATALGFSVECSCAKKFLPSGEDATLYVMVRK